MTNKDAIKWLKNLKNDLDNPRYKCLWHYAHAIDKICELLKEMGTVVWCKECKHYDIITGICGKGNTHGYADTWSCADGERRVTQE